MTKTYDPKKVRVLVHTAKRLVTAVEGVDSVRWQSGITGKRLKDIRQWCEFYVAVREIDYDKHN